MAEPPSPPGAATSPPRPLSQVLLEIGRGETPRVSIQNLVDAFADRGYAALMILFAVPNLLPLPPGSSTVFGLPLALVALQLVLGRARLWLPTWLCRRSLDRTSFAAISERSAPYLRRFERPARPRY